MVIKFAYRIFCQHKFAEGQIILLIILAKRKPLVLCAKNRCRFMTLRQKL